MSNPLASILYLKGSKNKHNTIVYDLNMERIVNIILPVASNEIFFYLTFDENYIPTAHQNPPQLGIVNVYQVKSLLPPNQTNLVTYYHIQISNMIKKIQSRPTNYGSPPKDPSFDISKFLEPKVSNFQKEVIFPGAPKASQDDKLIIPNFNISELGVGGLNEQLKQVFQNVFAARILNREANEMGINPVRGILLYGPPGCGKTLIARQLSKIINAKSFKYVAGPEIQTKFVGGSEENIRKLFAPAEKDRDEGNPGIHVIVFDEFDSLATSRDSKSNSESSSSVGVDIVNQLLTKIDGVDALNNVLLIAMTNRKSSLDPALLRPGRFEIHIEITLPDLAGREQIFNIHSKKLLEKDYLGDDVDIHELAKITANFSGAEIESIVSKTASAKLMEKIDLNTLKVIDNSKPKIDMQSLIETIQGMIPQMAESLAQMANIKGEESELLRGFHKRLVDNFKEYLLVENNRSINNSVLIIGKSEDTNILCANIVREMQSSVNYSAFITPEYYMNCNKNLWKLFDENRSFDKILFVINSFETLSDYNSKSQECNFLRILLNCIVPNDKHIMTIVTCSDRNFLEGIGIIDKFKMIIEI